MRPNPENDWRTYPRIVVLSDENEPPNVFKHSQQPLSFPLYSRAPCPLSRVPHRKNPFSLQRLIFCKPVSPLRSPRKQAVREAVLKVSESIMPNFFRLADDVKVFVERRERHFD